ncbi:hypothetical protein PG987_002167 [Apiospora arundinis]
MSTFTRLVRFLARDGRVYYGDAILPRGVTDIAKTRQARIVTGDIFGKHEVTDQVADVRLLLAPLALEDVKTVRCLGLNYEKHANESNMPIPKYPVLFYKPVTSLAGPTDPIPVHQIAQEEAGLDYECELVAVIGKRCSDVSEADALKSSGVAASGPLGKGFDGWAPYGPGIVSSNLIKDPQTLKISTRINGQTVQKENTADMIFNVKQTISFLSKGHTLLPGDLIFTGTPSGVGMGREPKLWLKDGDVVEVELESVGTCTNTVEFAKEAAKL